MSYFRIGFKVEAGPLVGVGHVMRCVAIAEQLHELGHKVSFIGKVNDIPWVQDLLIQYDIKSVDEVSGFPFDAIVVDTYLNAEDWISVWRSLGCLTVLIADDSTPKMKADFYIVPGIADNWRPPNNSQFNPILRGASAILLRRGVLRGAKVEQNLGITGPSKLFVMLGGSSSKNHLNQILHAITSAQFPAEIHVLGEAPSDMQWDGIFWHSPTAAIAPLMDKATVLICAAGVSSWEALHRGVPVALVSLAPNQDTNYSYMSRQRCVLPSGQIYRGEPLNVANVRWLLDNPEARMELGIEGMQLVDGLGACRAANAILELLESKNDFR